MDSNPPYKKFVVYAFKDTDQGTRVPLTGIDITLEYAKERLKEGYTIQVRPYTQEEWAAKGN